mmetsp:Transcript_25150/g.40372  ORF Transcript_25150/g.40372 Transcript_25150/m.40372 type:complete len:111 (-) Transcript_25150:195-527(-)
MIFWDTLDIHLAKTCHAFFKVRNLYNVSLVNNAIAREEEEEIEEEEEKGEAEMQSDSRNGSNDDPGSVQSLDSLLWKGFHFDLEAYKEMNPPPKSVHIGLLRVSKKKQRD